MTYPLNYLRAFYIWLLATVIILPHKISSQNNSLIINGAYITMKGGNTTNSITLVVAQSSTLGIVRNGAGHIHSEGQYNFIKWTAGTTTGNYVFPFGVGGNAADYIPFTFSKTTAGSSNISLSTWSTTAQNLPHPGVSNVAAVSNMLGATDSVNKAVDRFWDIHTSAAVTADLLFSYRGIENTTLQPSDTLRAQHWNGASWDAAVGVGKPGVTSGIGNTGFIIGQSAFSPWTLTRSCISALPVNITTAGNQLICNGNTTNLTATATGTINWYTAATGGTAIATGTVYTTPTLSTNTIYYAEQVSVCGVSPSRTAITITVNPTPVVAIGSVSSSTICSGSSLNLTSTGASTYTWSPALSLNTPTGSAVSASPTVTTIYQTTGTDVNNCVSAPASYTVTVNATPTVGLVSASSATICSGSNTIITPNGASTYTLNPGALTGTGFTVSPTANTIYTITGSNASTGCISTAGGSSTVNVTVQTSPTVGLVSASSTTICSGTNTTITPNGASTYTLNPGGLTGTSFTVSPTANTIYTITGSNASTGCISTAGGSSTVNVTVQASPTVGLVSASSTTICSGTNTTITPNGASTYTLNPGALTGTSFTVSPVATTIYTVTGTNSITGCVSLSTTPVTVNVTVNATPTVGLVSASSTTICSGTNTTITPNGASTYTLNPGALTGTSFTVSPTANTIYTITGSNTSTGCISTTGGSSTVNVTVQASPTVGLVSASSTTICSGTNTTITPNGATTYTLNPGALTGTSFTVSPGTTTIYTITGTNSITGCVSLSTTPVTVSVMVNASPTVGLVSASSTTICSGTNTTITPNGASTYTLNPGALTGSSFTVSPLTTIIYTITGTDVTTACVSNSGSSALASVTVKASPTVGLVSASSTTICSGTGATITPSGATTYTLNPGGLTGTGFTVTPGASIIYTVTGIDAVTSCTNSNITPVTVSVTVNASPTVGLVSGTSATICSGASTTITPSGATTYTLNPGSLTGTSFTVSPGTSTIYTVTGTDILTSCSNNSATPVTVNVTVNASPTVTIVGSNSTTVCSGTSYTITPNGASSYTLNPGSLTGSNFVVSPLANTIYTITGTNGITSCGSNSVSAVTVTITVKATPTLALVSAGSVTLCSGKNTIIIPSGATTYTLNPGALTGSSFTVSPSVTTIYTVTGTDALTACTSNSATSITASIVVNANPNANAGNDVTTCIGDQVNLTATGGGTYNWSNGANTATTVVTPTNTAYYTVTITGTNSCVAKDSVKVTVITQGSVLAQNDSASTSINQSVSTVVSSNDIGSANTVSIVMPPRHGVAVVGSNGLISYLPNTDYTGMDTLSYSICDATCTTICSTAKLIIRVNREIVIIVPQGFSPNGDGKNDLFEIKDLGYYPENELLIFNRWGDEVFFAKPYLNDWDGKHKGKGLVVSGTELIDGTYFYLLKLDKDSKPMKGYLELQRK